MKCLRTRFEFLKKCFLPFDILLLVLVFASCEAEPVYIAEEICINDIWTASESTNIYDTARESTQEWDGMTVYYTESGKVWHINADCPSLSRSENVIVGTVDLAKEAGKERVCKKCG